MEAFLVFSTLLLLTCSASSSSISGEDPTILQVTDEIHADPMPHLAVEGEFQAFLKRFGKEYGSAKEYARRLRVFARNIVRAAEHQALDPTAVHGVTPFSDLTEDEFERRFTGLAMESDKGRISAGQHIAPEMDTRRLPVSFDWREKGAVTDVKMQVYLFYLIIYFNFDICENLEF